jgi:hypothetical protein
MPPPPRITPQIRQLVLDLECERLGHQVNPYDALAGDATNLAKLGTPGADDDLKLPHMSCARCGYTWIVIPVGGPSYEDAERVVWNQLDMTTQFARKVLRDRSQRLERDRPPKDRDEPPDPKGG